MALEEFARQEIAVFTLYSDFWRLCVNFVVFLVNVALVNVFSGINVRQKKLTQNVAF